MAIIETEVLRGTFEAMVSLVVKTSPTIPTPTLQPLGNDRLIRQFTWEASPHLVPGFPGYTPPAGSLVLQVPIKVAHVSIAELRLSPGALGTTVDADAWILVTPTPTAVDLTLVGFAAKGAQASVLAVPVRIGGLPVPAPEGVGVVRAALVAGDRVVVLRMATSFANDVFLPLANRLPAVIDPPDADGKNNNWLIHVPAAFFTEWVLSRLQDALNPPRAGTTIEAGPSAQWTLFPQNFPQFPSGPYTWSVVASAEIEKEDACPSLFGDVDVSVEVTVSAAVTPNETENRIDIRLTVATNASDWDSFRCWLGSGGLAGMALGLVNPFVGIAAAIGSLIYVGEKVRHEVGDEAGALHIDGFTEIERTTSTVTYAGSVPVQPLPFSSEISMVTGESGLDVRGTMLAIEPGHVLSFLPSGGVLGGTWHRRIDCSARSFGATFAPQPVLIRDDLQLFGKVQRSLPVTVFLTSLGEPAGECHVPTGSGVNLLVPLDAHGLRPGETGFFVIHSSAGLRAYSVGPLPSVPALPLDSDRLLHKFCDTFHELGLLLEIQELKWVEPPPGYSYGHEPLRQWQIIVEEVTDLSVLEIFAGREEERRRIATATNLTGSQNRAAIEVTADDRTELWMRAPDAGEGGRVAVASRWLLPVHRIALPKAAVSLSRSGRELEIRSATSLMRYNLDTSRLTEFCPVQGFENVRYEPRSKGSRSLTLPGGTVAALHEDYLVIAVPINTLSKDRQSERSPTGWQQMAGPERSNCC
jgi:hypothetical protein